ARKRRAARAAAATAPLPPLRPSVEEESSAHEGRAIETVAAEPGLTAVQLAERMDVPASVLFRLLPALQREGRLRKQGKGYFPA
ncbi:helix-turn-helix domain-containing protein, partial [Patulibacter sp. S7RM1-6]